MKPGDFVTKKNSTSVSLAFELVNQDEDLDNVFNLQDIPDNDISPAGQLIGVLIATLNGRMITQSAELEDFGMILANDGRVGWYRMMTMRELR